MRSAVMVCVYCGGLLLRRQTMLANSFALAWLMVAALNPTDLFNAGCQLSFLSVAVLYWGTSRWFAPRPDPLEQLVEESRPLWLRLLRQGLRFVLISYAVTLAIWLALAPLVAARYHLISLAGILIGPALVTSLCTAMSGRKWMKPSVSFDHFRPFFPYGTRSKWHSMRDTTCLIRFRTGAGLASSKC
jgi:competence protein ComEC